MIPPYADDGRLDYAALLETLERFVSAHRRSVRDVVIVQSSIHDIYFVSAALAN
jgi:hypothetical protein